LPSSRTTFGENGRWTAIAKAKDRGVKFGRKRELTDDRVKEIRTLRELGETVPAIIKRTGFSKGAYIERLMHNGDRERSVRR
jgi:DNA invertase Pin-like site-specific DNA recombinase